MLPARHPVPPSRLWLLRPAKMGDMIPISEFLDNEAGNMGGRDNKLETGIMSPILSA